MAYYIIFMCFLVRKVIYVYLIQYSYDSNPLRHTAVVLRDGGLEKLE